MEDNFINTNFIYFLKAKMLDEIIMDLKNIELPPEWTPRDVLGFVINKIELKKDKL